MKNENRKRGKKNTEQRKQRENKGQTQKEARKGKRTSSNQGVGRIEVGGGMLWSEWPNPPNHCPHYFYPGDERGALGRGIPPQVLDIPQARDIPQH